MKKAILIGTITTSLLLTSAIMLYNPTEHRANAESNTQIENDFITTTCEVNYSTDYKDNNATQDRYNYSTNSTYTDDYMTIYMNNYGQTDTTQDRYNTQNYFIAQILPYRTLTNGTSTIDIQLHLEFDIQPNYTDYTFYETIDNIANFTNIQNWTTDNIPQQCFNATNMQSNNKRMLINSSADLDNDDSTTIYLGKVHINANTPTYIYGYITNNGLADFPISADRSTIIANSISINGQLLIPIQPIEVIDIAGLMLQILTMPFSFISQAFNITLFTGTPYQINISSLFLGIITIALFLWLLKVILGKADLGNFINDSKPQRRNNKEEKKVDKNV